MTPELIAEYEEASRPFTETSGPVPPGVLQLRSWRYFVEINTTCNLHCTMCICGNREGYDHVSKGIMDMDLLGKILDKIRNENNQAIIHPYGNSEPFLHPNLAECFRMIKARGLQIQYSSNLNVLRDEDAVMATNPDIMIISTSGFTQEIYEKAHQGGKIDRVKANMQKLAECVARVHPTTAIYVSFHKYKYNLHEVAPMEEFARNCGFNFFSSWARAISLENSIQHLRQLEREQGKEVAPYGKDNQGRDVDALMPPMNPMFRKNTENLRVPPERAVDLYKNWPIAKVCPVGDAYTYIRHDGLTSLCACLDDRRLNLGDYLTTSQEEISAMRRGNPVCHECLRFRMNLYFNIVDSDNWNAEPPSVTPGMPV